MPSLLQVACSLKGPGWATARQCNQYPEYCDSGYVGNVTAPRQKWDLLCGIELGDRAGVGLSATTRAQVQPSASWSAV